MSKHTKKLVLSALFMALGLVLPFITMQIPAIGKMLCPMHIPIMLCGVFCGWEYGLIVGFITPLLRGVLFGMPALLPNGVAMAFELATYGFIIAVMIKLLSKKILNTYVALITSMICGRIIWGLARYILVFAGLAPNGFTWQMFVAGALTDAIPGIIIQLVIIPPLVAVLRKNIRQDY